MDQREVGGVGPRFAAHRAVSDEVVPEFSGGILVVDRVHLVHVDLDNIGSQDVRLEIDGVRVQDGIFLLVVQVIVPAVVRAVVVRQGALRDHHGDGVVVRVHERIPAVAHLDGLAAERERAETGTERVVITVYDRDRAVERRRAGRDDVFPVSLIGFAHNHSVIRRPGDPGDVVHQDARSRGVSQLERDHAAVHGHYRVVGQQDLFRGDRAAAEFDPAAGAC